MVGARLFPALGIAAALGAAAWVVLDAAPGLQGERGGPAQTDQVAALEAENAWLRKEIARLRTGRDLGLESAEAPEAGAPPRLAGRAPPPIQAPTAVADATIDLYVDGLRRAVAGGQKALVTQYRTALFALGRACAPALLRVLGDTGEREALRVEAVSILAVIDGDALGRALASLLDQADLPASLRSVALATLPVKDGMTIPSAVRALTEDPDAPPADREAAMRIVLAADPQEGAALVRALLASGEAAQRRTALQLLTGARHPALRPVVQEVIEEGASDGEVRKLLDALAAMKGRNWATVQMTGPADTPVGGDLPTAWASKTGDMGEVWIEVDFARSVVPESVRVHESFNPGAIRRVLARQPGARWETLWEGDAPGGAAPRVFEPSLARAGYPAKTIRLVLDTDRVPGWNEIDAVELVGDGLQQWAEAARASSSYADE